MKIMLKLIILAAIILTTTSAAQADLSEGLVGYWKFDEGVGTTAADASIEVYPAQTPHTATLYNGVGWSDGAIGKALSFDGTDDYASVAAAPEIDNLGPLTCAVWMYTTTENGCVLDKGGRKALMLYGNANNPRNLRFSVAYSTANLNKYSASNNIPLNQWAHVAVTWDGTPSASGVRMYINGAETSYSASYDGQGTPDSEANYSLFIGKYIYASAPNHYLHGSLDEVAIYNRALSASEIQELYTLTASGSSVPLTPINSAPVISLSATQTVVWPNPAALAAFVSDDGLPTGASVTTQWSVISGAGAVSFTRQTYSVTDAAFSAPGSFIVRLSATDGVLSSYQDVQVTVMPEPLRLQIQKSGTGSGSVSGSGINCGADCSETFRSATSVTLSANPVPGSAFIGWVGGGCTDTGSCTVLVDAAKTVTAFFDTTETGIRLFYVDTQNPAASDANPGTQTQPWRTIQKAASTAAAGDKVIVKAGEYNEFVTMQQNGTAENPIVFEGERGPDGEWLTIIDPSSPASSGWAPAPEIGAGVYKKTDMAFETHELTIDHKRVAFVYTIGNISAYSNSGLTTGAQILAVPSNATLITNFGASTINFWDGVEALWGASGNTTYLRLRNGASPNGMNIRAAPNLDNSQTRDIYKPAVKIQDRTNIIFRNFLVRGAFAGVYIAGQNSRDNVVESNYFIDGYSRVSIFSGAHHNIVRNNEITAKYYGYADPGAWGAGADYRHAIRKHLYIVDKFLMGGAMEDDHGVKLVNAGAGNEIYGNKIFNNLGQGIMIAGRTTAPTTDTAIHDNTIYNTSSHGIMIWEGHTGTKIHDNLVYDNNINLRFHHMNAPNETDRRVYIYRNRLWLPERVGQHIYNHFFGSGGSYQPEFWVYHNSFSGGAAGFEVSNSIGLPRVRFLNNIFSNMEYYHTYELGFVTNKSMLGVFDYNLVIPPFPSYPITTDPAWFGVHNKKLQNPIWSTAGIPDFVLPSGSEAIDAGIDLSRQFAIDGVAYPGLPGMNEGYFSGSAPDIGACEYNPQGAVEEDISGDGTITAYDAALALEQGRGALEAALIAQQAVAL